MQIIAHIQKITVPVDTLNNEKPTGGPPVHYTNGAKVINNDDYEIALFE